MSDDRMSDEDRKRMFDLLQNMIMKALAGEFDPLKGGLKRRIREDGSTELYYVQPIQKPHE